MHTTNWPRERHETVAEALAYAEKRWGLTPETVPDETADPGGRWDRAMSSLVGEPWAEKVQLAWDFIPTWLRWFPQGKALLIVRDPRSVLASFREYTIAPEPAYLGAAFNCLDCLRWILESGPDTRVSVLRYEDVATHPRPMIRGTWTWLGLDPADVDPDIRWSEKGQDRAASDRSSFDDPDDVDPLAAIERWRGRLSESELRFVETVCGHAMERTGYETEGVEPLPLPEMRQMCAGDPRLECALERWATTGEGSCFFPLDPEDESTWTKTQGVA